MFRYLRKHELTVVDRNDINAYADAQTWMIGMSECTPGFYARRQ